MGAIGQCFALTMAYGALSRAPSLMKERRWEGSIGWTRILDVTETKLTGVLIITPKRFGDDRGFFS
jgi:hypothetical protein